MLDHDENRMKADDSAFEQFLGGGFAGPEPASHALRWTPEKYLAAAVLTDALIEVREFGAHPARRKQVAEDLQWIFSDAADSPFSFRELCTIFDLDPSYLRGIVLHWLRDALAALGEKSSRRSDAGPSEGADFLARVIQQLRQS